MKRIQLILTTAVLFAAASCSSTKNVSTTPDDVYYSAADHQYEPQPAAATSDYSRDNSNYNPDNNTNYSQSPSSTEQYTDDKGNTYVTNNYYNSDDYYDYEYSARLRRYYAPAAGYGYYDPYYTNSYWYDYNPYNYGVSIYLGYNFWAPAYCYYNPFYYPPVYPYPHFYFGWYNSWYTPYYGYYGYPSPYAYNQGFNDGYWNGYNNGYYASAYNNPYYYNSYDGNSVYYGPRGTISTNVSSTSPSPRATLGEKYQKSLVEQVVPVMDPKQVVQSPVSGTGRPNTSSAIQGTDKNTVGTVTPKNDLGVKDQQAVEPIRQSISDKNLNGTKPVVNPSSYSTSGRDNTTGIDQTPRSNGGNVRPEIDQPSRSNNINYSRPRNQDVQATPQDNRGGTVKPATEQPRNQSTRPGTVPQRDNQYTQPRNTDNNMYNKPRGEQEPLQINPRVEPKSEPRVNPSYERPRQEVQPRIEPRQEPRQYKQEHSQPKQNESFSTPSPRQQNMSTPSQKNNSSSGDNKGGGRRK